VASRRSDRMLIVLYSTGGNFDDGAVTLQPFYQKSPTSTVAQEFQIGLWGVVEADLELLATVGVWDFWENGCRRRMRGKSGGFSRRGTP